jgi:hypothetical protein
LNVYTGLRLFSGQEQSQHHIQLHRKEGVLGNQGSQLLIATQKVTIIIPPCPPPADVKFWLKKKKRVWHIQSVHLYLTHKKEYTFDFTM